jgi:hypothetical protein
MRYIKRQSTNTRGLVGRGIHVTPTDKEVILDSENVVLIPKGPTEKRPQFPRNGHLRYNTDTDEFEMYQDDAWRKMRFKEPNRNPGIIVQSLGLGDANETVFGPLNSQDLDYPVPVSAAHVLVFVENVYQLPNTNYNLVQNPLGKAEGWYLEFASSVDLDKPVTVLHNFDK